MTSGPLALTSAYDKVGNVTSITDTRPGYSQTFSYDALDRLTTVTGFGAGTFAYDERGNRTHKNGVLHTYGATTDRLTSDGVTTYGYDDSGNLVTAGTATATYTPFQMLETATVNGAMTTYGYDGDNQRRMRTTSAGIEYFVPGPGLVPLADHADVGGTLIWRRDYIYVGAHAVGSGGGAPAAIFTDDPVVTSQTTVRALHLTELRGEVNAVRARYHLPHAAWLRRFELRDYTRRSNPRAGRPVTCAMACA